MNFNTHSDLTGKHAPFSPSQYSWLRDSEDDMIQRYCNMYAASVGTILHGMAKDYIDWGVKMTRFDKKQIPLTLLKNGIPPAVVERLPVDDIFETLSMHINDAIGFGMKAEVVLYYSDFVFGTTDAICFNESTKHLRIHDLKTGTTPAKIDQLMIYDALFCLEYGHILHFRPEELTTELRIYQSGDFVYCNPNPDDVIMTMEQIKRAADCGENLKRGGFDHGTNRR